MHQSGSRPQTTAEGGAAPEPQKAKKITVRIMREMTKNAEHGIHVAVLSCERAGSSWLPWRRRSRACTELQATVLIRGVLLRLRLRRGWVLFMFPGRQ